MKTTTNTIVGLALMLCTGIAKAQISGVVTVPGTYTSIAAVINTLNVGGVSGAVTINIAAGYTETAPLGGYQLNAIAGASSSNQVIFHKSGSGANPLITAYSGGFNTPASAVQDGVWRFVGTDYVTIDGIDITDPNTVNPATMEFAYGFFKASGTDGCQNNTIKNCVITMNRVNNAAGSGPAVEGSRGINVVNSLPTSQTTALTVLSASGSNSNNRFYSNTIQNCNVGISLIGYGYSSSNTAFGDSGNDIGGSSSATGNTIINFGGGGTTSQAEAITTLNQYSLNVSYNVVNSNNGSGVNHNQVTYGIYIGAAVSANASINNNTVTLVCGGSTNNSATCIYNTSGSTAAGNTINMNNNVITNCVFSPAGGASWNGMMNFGNCANLNMNNNSFINNTIAGTTSSGGFLHNSGNVTGVINVNNNAGNGYAFANATSSSFNFVYMNAAASTATININGNTAQNMTNSVTTSGSYVLIHNGPLSAMLNINGNTWTNLNLNTTGSVTFIENTPSENAGCVQNINGNAIIGSFTKPNSGGTVTFYTSTGNTSSSSSTLNATGNNFSNVNLVGSTALTGWTNTDGSGSPTKIFTANTFSNLTCGTGAVTVINFNRGGNNTSISSNTVINVTGGGAITGIAYGSNGTSSLATLSNNVISSLTSTNGAVTGISIAGSPAIFNINNNSVSSLTASGALASGFTVGSSGTNNIFANRIGDITSNGSGGTVNGLTASSGTCNIYNNLIGDLKAPATSSTGVAISGIYVSGGSLMNIYFNSVHLNAASSGSAFSTAALNTVVTPTLDLRNNILINRSTPSGSGISAAFRRGASLTTYAATSNNNLFYAGIPSANRLVFYDGVNLITSLAAFKALTVTRDQASVEENVAFVSISGTNTNFLVVDPAVGTQVESNAAPVSTITTDFAGTSRNAGTPDIGALESTYTPYTACSGTPAAISAVASASMLCPNAMAYVALAATYTNSGLSYQWQQSVSGAVGPYFSIPGATTTAYSGPVALSNLWYRAVVTCSAGGSITSAPALITVGPDVSPAAVASTASLCGGASSTLSLINATGPAGLTYQWQASTTSASGPYSPVSNATLTSLTATNITATTWYQAVVSCSAMPSFSVASTPVQINVNTLTITPVTAAGGLTVCPNATSALSLSGVSGSGLTYQWQSSATGAAGSYSAIASATSSAYTATVAANTWYQAVISCSANASASVASTPVLVTAGAPTISPVAAAGSTIVCPTATAALSLSGVSGSGLAYQWQSATTSSAGVYSAISTATTSGSTVTVPVTSWYQAVVSCSANPSFSVASTVVQVTAGGTVIPVSTAASTTICPNATSALNLSASGPIPSSGLSYQWMASTTGSGGTYSAVSNATTAAYTATVGSTTWYQAVITCTANSSMSVTSVPVQVTVGSPSINPITVAANPNVCAGSAVALTLANASAPAGITYQWQNASAAAGPYTAIGTATSSSYNATVNATGWYQAVMSCSANTAYSVASVPVQVNASSPLVNAAAVAASTTICPNATSALTLNNNSGFSGLVYQWQASPSGSAGTYSSIASATSSAYTATVGSTTWYQAVISCSANSSYSVASTPVQVTVGSPSLSPVAAAASTLICFNGASALSLTNGSGPAGISYQWMASTSGSAGTYSAVSTATTSAPTVTVPVTLWYQAVISCSANPSYSVASTPVLVTVGTPSASPVAAAASTLICPNMTNALSLTGTSGLSGVSYQWMASPSGSAGTYSAIPSGTVAAYTSTSSATAWYQAVITCTSSPSNSIASTPVLVTVGVPVASTVTAASSSTVLCANGSVNLSLSATGGSSVLYQWQTSSTSSASGYAAIANATLSTLTNTTGAIGSNWYQAVISCSTDPTYSVVSAPVAVTQFAVPGTTVSAATNTTCTFSTFTLNGTTDIGTGFIWNGPASYTSNTQNAVITNPSAGVYTLIATANTCSSIPATFSLSTLGNFLGGNLSTTSASICAGSTTTLQAAGVGTNVSAYVFAASTGSSLITLTSPTTVIAAAVDDTPMVPSAIGFAFNFHGTDYTQFAASPDGWVTFGGPTFTSAPGSQITNNFTSSTNVPKIAPFWDDLSTALNGYVKAQLMGSAPSRYLVIEWNVGIPRTSSWATTAANSTYQAIIYEGTNAVEFRFGAMNSSTATTASSGIAGDASNYISVTTANTTTSSTSSSNSNTLAPASGTSYMFTMPPMNITYTWAPAASLSSVSGSSVTSMPTAATVYSVNYTYQGCLSTKTISVITYTTVNITATNTLLCAGSTATLTASGASGYTWSTGSTNSVVAVSPLVNTVYTVTGANGSCGASTQTVAVNISNSSITISGSSGICTGQTATLIASGVSTYTWSTGATTSSITDAPATNGTFTYGVAGTDAQGCVIGASQQLNVASGLNIAIGGSSVICLGQTANLSGSGGVTYTWSTTETTSTIAPTPTTSTTYTLIGASGTCSNTAVKTITVNPTPSITVSNATVCAGTTTTLSAGGAATYSCNTGSTASTAVVSPTATSVYTVTGTSSLNCTNTKTVSVTTNTLPVIVIAQTNTAACAMVPVTFTASGANTYSWTSGPNTAVYTATPNTANAAGVYTVTGANIAGCISTKTVGLITYSLPVVSISPASATICLTSSVQLTAAGASSFAWSGGPLTSSYNVSPVANTTYTVSGTTSNGCISSATAAVATNSLPALSVVSSASTVCSQSPVSYTVLGASSYVWSNLVYTNTVTMYPVSNTIYTVTGTSSQSCSSTATVAVSTLSLPVIAVTPPITTVCVNAPTSFTASGAVTYTWANSSVTGSTAVLTPTGLTSYNVSGTDVNGCTSNGSFLVFTNPSPAISIAASSPTACSLSATTFTATGADTYSWSNSQSGDVVTVHPANATTYTVTGTNSITGCTGTETVAVTTLSLPVVSIAPASPTVCYHSPLTLTGSGASTYLWSNGSINNGINLTPTTTVTYTLTGTDAIGCSNIQTVTVTVNALPTIVAASQTVCLSDVATFTPSGASTYTMMPGNLTTYTVSQSIAGLYTYTVSGTDNNSCVNKTTVILDVEVCNGIKTQSFSGNVVSVYPNPSTGVFTAQFNYAGEKQVMILNSVGELMLERNSSATSEVFDITHLAKGVYFVRVSSKEASGNYKIVIE